jgi:hypothetical protein
MVVSAGSIVGAVDTYTKSGGTGLKTRRLGAAYDNDSATTVLSDTFTDTNGTTLPGAHDGYRPRLDALRRRGHRPDDHLEQQGSWL